MKLLKIDLPKHDTKSIYYVADNINKEGPIKKAPNQDYKLAIKTSVTINGKKVFKRKVHKFKKIQTLISAISIMQKLRAELRAELKTNAPVIVKVGAVQAKKQNYLSEVNPHKERTLNMAWDDYLKVKEDKKLSKETINSYMNYYSKHIEPVLGDCFLHTIETNDFQDIINKILKDGRAPRTAQTVQQIMRPLFNKELHTKGTLLKTNPVLNTVIPRYNNEKTINITDDEAKELISQIYNYEDVKIRSVLIWLTHGRRAGEVRNLKWEHIDFENNTYTIVAENNKARKNMSYKMTEAQLKALPSERKEKGYVFSSFNDINKTLAEGTVRPHWKEVVKRAGLKSFRLHDLRHLIGGQLVSAGYSLEQIASVLGHTTTAVTQRYSKVRETVANEALGDFFERVGR